MAWAGLAGWLLFLRGLGGSSYPDSSDTTGTAKLMLTFYDGRYEKNSPTRTVFDIHKRHISHNMTRKRASTTVPAWQHRPASLVSYLPFLQANEVRLCCL